MDPVAVVRTVDSTLWSHFGRFVYVSWSYIHHTAMGVKNDLVFALHCCVCSQHVVNLVTAFE